MTTLKGPGAPQTHDGSNLRIAIVHARWNTSIISALVTGARKTLLASGVREENIIVQDVPGSYELPFAVQRIYQSSLLQSSLAQSHPPGLLSSASKLLSSHTTPLTQPFDAVIAIGVLIKGETMHFEYIAEATSQGLMRVQLDLGVPVVFGLLTVLTEEQGLMRAGLIEGGHCHGEDWGAAAVELGVKRGVWGGGGMV